MDREATGARGKPRLGRGIARAHGAIGRRQARPEAVAAGGGTLVLGVGVGGVGSADARPVWGVAALAASGAGSVAANAIDALPSGTLPEAVAPHTDSKGGDALGPSAVLGVCAVSIDDAGRAGRGGRAGLGRTGSGPSEDAGTDRVAEIGCGEHSLDAGRGTTGGPVQGIRVLIGGDGRDALLTEGIPAGVDRAFHDAGATNPAPAGHRGVQAGIARLAARIGCTRLTVIAAPGRPPGAPPGPITGVGGGAVEAIVAGAAQRAIGVVAAVGGIVARIGGARIGVAAAPDSPGASECRVAHVAGGAVEPVVAGVTGRHALGRGAAGPRGQESPEDRNPVDEDRPTHPSIVGRKPTRLKPREASHGGPRPRRASAHPVGVGLERPFRRDLLDARPELDGPLAGHVALAKT